MEANGRWENKDILHDQKEKREAGIVNTLKGWIGKNDVEKSIPDVVNRIW